MIKIYSDGTPGNTRVYQENGAEITGIKHIEWWIDAERNVARATMTFDHVEVEVSGALEE